MLYFSGFLAEACKFHLILTGLWLFLLLFSFRSSLLIHLFFMHLIVDAGSSKTLWYEGQTEALWLQSPGLNPLHLSEQEGFELLTQSLANCSDVEAVLQIDFFGAGCATEASIGRVRHWLQAFFPQAQLQIRSDLWAAVLSCTQGEAGLVGILGTGSNACYFDGQAIEQRSQSLGFWLGDEGSGLDLAKRLLRAYAYGRLSAAAKAHLEQEYALSRSQILHEIYTQGQAKAYLNRFTPFLAAWQEEPSIGALIEQAFEDYFDYHFKAYATWQKLPLHLVGSIAHHFEPRLRAVLGRLEQPLGKILQHPFPHLFNHYRTHGQ